MELPIVLLLAAVALIVVAVVWLVFFKYPEHSTGLYERRTKANADYRSKIAASAKPIYTAQATYIVKAIHADGRIEYDTLPPVANAATPSVADAAATADPVAAGAARLIEASVEWIHYPLGDNHKDWHEHGAEGHQLLTAEESIAAGIFTRNDDWQAAVNYLVERHGVKRENKPKRNGMYTPDDKPLYKLIQTSAVGKLMTRAEKSALVIGREWSE